MFFDIFLYNEDYKIASDWEFFVYTICYANVATKYLNKTIALYNFTGISSDKKFSQLFLDEKLKTLTKFFPCFVDDYLNINDLTSKRYLQFQHIKNTKYAWKFLKAIITFILLFLPKIKSNSLLSK